jgi:hypothetical protein
MTAPLLSNFLGSSHGAAASQPSSQPQPSARTARPRGSSLGGAEPRPSGSSFSAAAAAHAAAAASGAPASAHSPVAQAAAASAVRGVDAASTAEPALLVELPQGPSPQGSAPLDSGRGDPAGSGADADDDDQESVRLSVMSQRSYFSAVSHLESSASSLISPAAGSETSRRRSLQRELHAAAVAAAMAATAERRTAAAAAVASAGPGAGSASNAGLGARSAAAAALLVPPAAQQAFGSYLDQPPPYGFEGSGRRRDAPSGLPRAAADAPVGPDKAAPPPSSAPGRSGRHSRAPSRGAAGELGSPVSIAGPLPSYGTAGHLALDMSGLDGQGGTGLRPTSSGTGPSASVDECSGLGAGAVRWARGWFFRRRTYGRLAEGLEEGRAGELGLEGRSTGGRQVRLWGLANCCVNWAGGGCAHAALPCTCTCTCSAPMPAQPCCICGLAWRSAQPASLFAVAFAERLCGHAGRPRRQQPIQDLRQGRGARPRAQRLLGRSGVRQRGWHAALLACLHVGSALGPQG